MRGTKIRIALGIALSLCGMAFGIAAANVYGSASDDVAFPAPDRRCSKAAANKTFGKSEWALFSCDDDQTLVFVSAPGNPADPFYFTVFPVGSEYHVFGEGTGNRQATDAAYDDIQLLSLADIHALIDEAKSARFQ